MRHFNLFVLLLGLLSHAVSARDLLVSSRFSNSVLRYDGETGASLGVFASGHGLANPNGIAFGPDRNLYVGLGDIGEVLRFDGRTGGFLGKFVSDDPATPADETGGNRGCRAIAFGPDGNLYVDAGSISKVLAYDGRTGAYLRVAAEGNGMRGPVGLTFGPDGNLYVGAALSNTIHVFDLTGRHLRSFTCGAANQGVTGVLFAADGSLYAAASETNSVLRYEAATGRCLGVFAAGGGVEIPIGLALAPDGRLLVGSFDSDSVQSFNAVTGQPTGTFITRGSGGLDGTHNLAFVPPPLETTRTVPIVLDVATSFAHYTTELVLTNRGTRATSVRLSYHPSIGTAEGAGSITEELGAGRQRVVDDVIHELRARGLAIPLEGVQGGTLVVTFSDVDSEDDVTVTARTATSTASPQPAGRAGLAYTGSRGASGSRATIYGLRSSEADRSNLAVYNTGDVPVTLRVSVQSGDVLAVIREAETLAPHAWTQYSGVLDRTGVANGWATVERVGDSGSFGTYGVVNDNATNDGSFLLPVRGTVAGDRLTIPVLVETATFRSELVLANRSAAEVVMSLAYVESLSPALGAGGTVTVHLAPREQRIIPEAIDYLRRNGATVGAPGGNFAGAVRVSVAGAALEEVFAGARTAARSAAGGQFGLFTPGVAPGEEAEDLAFVSGLRADATNRSNIAVLHTGGDASGALSLELQVFDGDAAGAPRGAPTVAALQPGGLFQANNVLGTAGVANGWVRVRRISGTARWIAYGVVNDGGSPGERTGDGAYVPMEVVTVPAVPDPTLPPGTLGPAGGTISALGGTVLLEVPRGALAAPVAFTIRHTQTLVPLDAHGDKDSYVDVLPADVAFAVPAALTLPYDPARTPAGVPASALGVHLLSAGAFSATSGRTADAAAHRARGVITGGGTYGVRRVASEAPCTAPENRQFDFWLGSWAFSAPDSFPGSNTITRDAAGCIVEENFTQRAYKGRSLSLFDPATSKWYQTYVDNDNFRLVLAGALEGARMVLYENPTTRYLWEATDANHVRYFGQVTANNGVTWGEVFDALYTRR